MDHVRSLLTQTADQTKSGTLAAMAARVDLALRQESDEGAKEDHFVKVRTIIKDLIEKLEEDATAESTQKSTCDAGIKKATRQRDNANAKIEIATAKHTTLTADKNSLEDDNEALTAGIAELQKSLLEAQELHQKDVELAEEQIALW